MSVPDAQIVVGPLQSMPLDRTFLLPCAIHLDRLPKITKAGVIRVPSKPRVSAEQAIEHYANLISVATQAARRISSPSPCIALVPDSDIDAAFLTGAKGFLAEYVQWRALASIRPDLLTHMAHLQDRLDGLALAAAAISSGGSSGQFREFYRILERAFGLGGRNLLEPLAAFLAPNRQRFTAAEVGTWVAARDGVSHADRQRRVLLDGDVAAFIPRIQEAAYDCLFNKLKWRSSGVTRRAIWRPAVGTMGPAWDDGVFAVTGEDWDFNYQVLDEFGRFPLYLGSFLSAAPPGCWTGPFLSADGETQDQRTVSVSAE